MHVTGVELAELARAWEASDPDVAAARAGLNATPPPVPGLALQIDGVSKSYGTCPVLRDFTLRIEPGSFVALVGRSGCGKSTLLRLLAGLEPADTGAITRDGGHAQAGDVRLLFQDARLLPWKRVIDNVALGLPRRGAPEQAREALAQVGLAGRVPLARPRSRSAPAFAAFEEQVLQRVLGTPAEEPAPAVPIWPAHGLRWAV